jgi:hypothetical protein
VAEDRLGHLASGSLTKKCAKPILRLARQRDPTLAQFPRAGQRTIPLIDSCRHAAQRTSRDVTVLRQSIQGDKNQLAAESLPSNRKRDCRATEATPTHYDTVRKSQKVFKAIIRAIETAYVIDYVSWQLLPRPKVNILHRGLNEIAKAAGIQDQTETGFAEFLDDLCPCGLKNHREAVRKLASRSTRMRRPKE